jgi:dipeptidyl aminopeptidase/acylaminoacyl peptidase
MNVALLDIASKKVTWVTDVKWESFSGNFSPDGKSYTYVINEDGLIDAYLADRSTSQAEKLDLPHGLNSFSGNPNEFAPQSDRLIVCHQAPSHPGDLRVYNLASRHADQLTFSEVASLRATPLPPSEIVHYKTFDGKIITALLWLPFNLKRDGSNPALILPHGGPTGQMVDYWNTDVAASITASALSSDTSPWRAESGVKGERSEFIADP